MSLPWSSKGTKASPIGADELLILDSADSNPSTQNKRITITSLGFVAGEDNTASNVGAGDGWFKQKTGVDLQFKSLITTTPIVTTSNTDDLTVSLDPLVNADISSTALIEFSKLEDLPDTNILVGSNINKATPVAMSGDATINNTGALTVGANTIDDGKITTHTTTKITTTDKSLLNSNIVYNDQANTYGIFAQTFPTNTIKIRNSADTAEYSIQAGPITSDRTLIIPAVTGTDQFLMLAQAQTVANKTLTNVTINDFTKALHDHSDDTNAGNLTNSALTSGVFSAITGLGVQTQVLDMDDNTITALPLPLNDTEAASKLYVDQIVEGLAWKDPAQVATTADITLSGEQVIDGVLTSVSRVLVKDQTLGEENGVYLSDAGAWSRTTDADTESDLLNMSIFVQQGTVNDDTSWVLVTDAPIVVDTTVLNYVQVSGGFNSPLTTKGDLLGYDTGDTRIPVGSNGQVLSANSAVPEGVEWTSPAAASQTPWLQDIDADGFDLQDLSNLEFRDTTLAPLGTVPAIYKDVNGIKLNVETATTFQVNVNSSGEYAFSATEFDTLGNNILLGLGSILFDDPNTSINQNGIDLRSDVATSGTHFLRVNDTEEFSFNATEADFFENNLLNSGFLEQNEISEPGDPAAGLVRLWSEEDSGLSVLKYKGSTGLVNTISEDVFIPVRNTTGSTILKGKAVYVTGAQGQRVTVDLAKADSSTTMRSVGFMLNDLNNNSNGFVVVAGTQTSLDTSSFSQGDSLYVSATTAGEVVTTPPSHPNVSQLVGIVLVSNPSSGEVSVIPGDTNGEDQGTNKNSFLVGDGTAGTKSVDFVNTFTGSLEWNPSAARTVTIPDVTTTLTGIDTTDSLSNKTLTEPRFVDLGFIADANGNEMLSFNTITSAINYAEFANSATLTAPSLSTLGTDTNVDFRFIPKGTGTFYGNRESFAWPLTDETTVVTVGVKYVSEPAPYDLSLEDVIGGLTTAGSGAALFTFDILKEDSVNSNTFTTIFSTKPTIDVAEFTSTTAAAPPVLSVTTWEKGRRLQLSIDTIDTDGFGRGAKIQLLAHATAK